MTSNIAADHAEADPIAAEIQQIVESAIPSWGLAKFLFCESEPWWAPSVQAEISLRLQTKTDNQDVPQARCESFPTTRTLFEQLKADSCDGVVLITGDQIRDTLLFLGRLTRLCRPSPAVLVVMPREYRNLMPVLLESGASTVFCQPVSDQEIAGWCVRVTLTAGRS